MKKIIVLFVAILISANVEARRNQPQDIPVTIYFHDGTQREGFLRPLAVDATRVEFRSERGGRVERFESSSIERIRRYDEDDESFGEAVWLPRILVSISGNVRERGPRWLTVLVVGPVTLYRVFEGGMSHYFAKRENESTPRRIASGTDMTNIGGTVLRNNGWKFFEDTYPELAERIRNGEFENTSADVRAIVHEYNFRAGQR